MEHEWPEHKLGDLARIEIGGTPSRYVSAYWAREGGHPWLSIADLCTKWVERTAERITDAGVRYSNVKLIPAGTPVMSFKLSIGRVGILCRDMYSNEAIAAFHVESDRVNPTWLYYELPRAASRAITDTAIKGATLNKAKLRELTVKLPSIVEQRRIAEVLDTLDEAIRKTEQIIAKLKQVKQGLLHDLLTRGIDDNGELRDPIRHPEQFKDSPLGRKPARWSVESLGSLSVVVRGSTPRPAKDPRFFNGDFVPWITVGELSRDEWPYLTATSTGLTELGAKYSRRLEAGTLVLSNSGFGCGVPKLLQIAGCANDGIAAFLQLDDRMVPLFLYYYLFSQIDVLRTRVARGVDQPNLNTDLLAAFVAPVPDIAEQREIANRLFCVASSVRDEEAYLSKLRLLKQGLAEDLLTGRVRVLSDNDEELQRPNQTRQLGLAL